ncbi:MAG TPA: ComEC/Rec2 family competence protein [Candidatus Saccharimonadales bacterium]|nr:ComEC/Rec2 family competence protein [Candidatus Saccharimonadales bacterium]
MLKKWIVRRTTRIGAACFGFLAGLGLVQLGLAVEGWLVWSVLILVLIACSRFAVWALIAAALAGFILGLWRGGDALHQQGELQALVGQKIVLQGQVATDATYDDRGQLDIRLSHVVINGRSYTGVVRVKSFSVVGVQRGDVVQAAGKMQSGFGNYQAALYFAELHPIAKTGSWFETARRHFAAVIYSNIPEPQASLGLGFLLGLKSSLPDTLNDQLKVLGLTHIVVASGYNLTILIRLSRRIFEKVSKFQAAAVSGGLLAAFLAITGFSPSMSRAALVTGLALVAWYYGRRIKPAVLLLVAAAITAGINPLFLWFDLGWWLSFLAFAGVLLLAPLLQYRFLGKAQPRMVTQVIFETLAAQLLTLPLILWVFGDFSVLALLANILIVPLIPLAMAATFLAGIVAFLAPPIIAGFAAWPATIILSYMSQVITLLASVPWATVTVAITTAGMIGLYATLCIFGAFLWFRVGRIVPARSIVE